VKIYEIFDGDPDQNIQLKQETAPLFETALHLYQQGQFGEACQQFTALLTRNPGDQSAAYYQAQSAQRAAQPVPTDWDGVELLTEK
jgi:hypothetical protein